MRTFVASITLAALAVTGAFVAGAVGVVESAAAEDRPVSHLTLEKGVEAAKKSGRPLLVVTAWKSGI